MTPLVPSPDHDAALISESLSRPEAFAGLFDRHAAVIHRFVARRVGEHVADDIVAETFLTAFRRRERYELDRLDARPWLYGIAVKLIGTHRRSEVRMWRAIARSGVDLCAEDGLAQVDDRVDAVGARSALAAALGRLAARDRDVLLLVAWADLSYDEVAMALEVPVGTVRSRLSRARTQLRAELNGLQAKPPTEELCSGRA